MPVFEYVARDMSGQALRGRVQAQDSQHAAALLRAQGLFLTSLRSETRTSRAVGPLRPVDLANFAHHVSTLLGAGLTITGALQVLEEHAEDEVLGALASALRAEVEEGATLSQALERVRADIPDIFVGFVRGGEATGRLDLAFQRLNSYLERELEFRRKVREALFYPAVVLTVAVVVVGAFLLYVVPAFERVYRAAGASLPPLTQALMVTSRVLGRFVPLLGGVAVALALPAARRSIGQKVWRSTEPLLGRAPKVGPLLRLSRAARFLHSLGASLTAGVPVTSAVRLAAGAAGRPGWVGVLQRHLEEGSRLTEGLRAIGEVPAVALRLVALGEESGQVGEMATRAAEVLDREFEMRIKRLLAALEPALTVALAVVVGVLLVALYMPIFGLGRAVLGR